MKGGEGDLMPTEKWLVKWKKKTVTTGVRRLSSQEGKLSS